MRVDVSYFLVFDLVFVGIQLVRGGFADVLLLRQVTEENLSVVVSSSLGEREDLGCPLD